ncbi:MAG: hypothetical protein PHV80_04250 [Rugosibacter sp.]|nr:hypothetical protein [Rugosibacter sp.]
MNIQKVGARDTARIIELEQRKCKSVVGEYFWRVAPKVSCHAV